jgi:hypothetical protein
MWWRGGWVALALVLPGCVPAEREAPRPAPREHPGPTSPSPGVIRPPRGIDPGIHTPVPVPDPRTTPVIPPPGSPGGDPRIQPR